MIKVLKLELNYFSFSGTVSPLRVLSAVRSEKILASQMHTPAPPNCSSLTNSLESDRESAVAF